MKQIKTHNEFVIKLISEYTDQGVKISSLSLDDFATGLNLNIRLVEGGDIHISTRNGVWFPFNNEMVVRYEKF